MALKEVNVPYFLQRSSKRGKTKTLVNNLTSRNRQNWEFSFHQNSCKNWKMFCHIGTMCWSQCGKWRKNRKQNSTLGDIEGSFWVKEQVQEPLQLSGAIECPLHPLKSTSKLKTRKKFQEKNRTCLWYPSIKVGLGNVLWSAWQYRM